MTFRSLLATMATAGALSLPAAAQQLPSDDAMSRAMQAAQQRAAQALNEAERRSAPAPGAPQRVLPQFKLDGHSGIDPAAIAERYRQVGRPGLADPQDQLMVFVSLSMPEEALRRIGLQARRAGGVVVFRGLKYGLRNGAWAQSMNALKPIADTGADVQVHPELFRRYHVTAVPTLVIAAAPQPGCQDDACATASASVVGDVTLDYALEQLADRDDPVGAIARERLKRLKQD